MQLAVETLRVEGKGQRTLQAPNQGKGYPTVGYLGSLQIRELLETLPILLLLLVLFAIDWVLYSIFDTIGHHSFVQYSFRSEPGPRPEPTWQPPPSCLPYLFLPFLHPKKNLSPIIPVLTGHPLSIPPGSHKLEINVEGDSILARLLRKTIGALNTTSDTEMETNNMRERCQRLGSCAV